MTPTMLTFAFTLPLTRGLSERPFRLLQTKPSQSIFESAEQAATSPRKGPSPPSLTFHRITFSAR